MARRRPKKRDVYAQEMDGVDRVVVTWHKPRGKGPMGEWRVEWRHACGCRGRHSMFWREPSGEAQDVHLAMAAFAEGMKDDVDTRREKDEGSRPWNCKHFTHDERVAAAAAKNAFVAAGYPAPK